MRPRTASTPRFLACTIVLLMAIPVVPAQGTETPSLPLFDDAVGPEVTYEAVCEIAMTTGADPTPIILVVLEATTGLGGGNTCESYPPTYWCGQAWAQIWGAARPTLYSIPTAGPLATLYVDYYVTLCNTARADIGPGTSLGFEIEEECNRAQTLAGCQGLVTNTGCSLAWAYPSMVLSIAGVGGTPNPCVVALSMPIPPVSNDPGCLAKAIALAPHWPIHVTGNEGAEPPLDAFNGMCPMGDHLDISRYTITADPTEPNSLGLGAPHVAVTDYSGTPLVISDITLQETIEGEDEVVIENSQNIQLQNIKNPDAQLVIAGTSDNIQVEDVEFDSILIDVTGSVDLNIVKAREIIIKNGDVRLDFVTLMPDAGDPGLIVDGGSVSVGSQVIFDDDGAPCMQASGGDILIDQIFWESASLGSCGNGVLRGAANKLTILDSQFRLLGTTATLFDVDVTDAVTIAGNFIAGAGTAVRISGPADVMILDNTFENSPLPLTIAGSGDWTVSGNNLTGMISGPISADGADAALAFTNNLVDGQKRFVASGAFEDQVTTTLYVPPAPGKNVLGFDVLAGNAWIGEDVADVDGDGIADTTFTPPGLVGADLYPIVAPNIGPTVRAWTDPDAAAPRTVFTAGTPFSVVGNVTDVDNPANEISWRVYAAATPAPPFNLGAEAILQTMSFADPGVKAITLEVRDAAGARASRTFDVFVEAANQAPIIDTMTVGRKEGSACTLILPGAQMQPGAELCLASAVHDPDTGILGRLDPLYVDVDGNGIAEAADARIDIPIPKGNPGYTKITGQALVPLGAGIATSSAGATYLDIGCDGETSVGDLRLAHVTLPSLPGETAIPADLRVRLRATDFDIGVPLGPCADIAFGYVDTDGDLEHSAKDALYAGPAPLPPTLEAGMLRIAPFADPLPVGHADIGMDLIALPEAVLAWDDADGDVSVAWRIGTAQYPGAVADATIRDLGSYAIHVVATDRGSPAGTAARSQTIDVISASPPDVRISVAPSKMVDGLPAVTRAREVTLRDATQTDVNTGIVHQSWMISWTDLDNVQHVVNGDDRPEWNDADAIRFTFDDHRIVYAVTHSVTLRNGEGGSATQAIRVLRTPPSPVLEYTPQDGVIHGEPVTFTAGGSIDLGDAVDHEGSWAIVGALLVADMDRNGILSAADMPLQTIAEHHAPFTQVDGTDLDFGRSVGQHASTAVCLRDNDIDGIADPGEELYIDPVDGCTTGAVRPGVVRIYSPDLPMGVFVGTNDDDIGAATIHLADAGLVWAAGQYYLDLAGDGAIDAGDLVLDAQPFYATQAVGDAEENATLTWSWGSLYVLAPDGPETVAGALRLTASQVDHAGMTVLGPASGAWVGTPPLVPVTRNACYSDVAPADGSYTPGESVFLSVGPCDVSALNDTRLQAQVEATGGHLAPGSLIGTDSKVAGFAHPDVGLVLAPLAAAQLATAPGMIALDLDGDGLLDAGDIRLSNVGGRGPASRVQGPTTSDNPGADAAFLYRWECRVGCGEDILLGTGPTMQTAFDSSGRKDVVLVVSDPDGNAVESRFSLVVGNTPPTPATKITRLAYPTSTPTVLATLTAPACATGCAPVAGANDRDVLRFDGTASFDADGPSSSLLYAWDLPDGTRLLGPVIEVGFEEPGTYPILLTVTDADGIAPRASEMWFEVDIANGIPVADFTIKTLEPITLSPVLFDAGPSSDPGGTIVHYEWTFSHEGGDAKRFGRTATFTWDKPGVYDVSLQVFDDQADGSPILRSSVAIANRAPVAVAAVDLPARLPPAEFQFTARDSIDQDGAISNYAWDFGDGSTGSGADVAHVFTDRGTFEVVLTVTDDQGATNSAALDVIVLNKPALLSVAIPKTATAGDVVPLEAIVQDPENGAVQIDWTITDAAGAQVVALAGTSVEATFPAWGTYTIRVVATDDAGAETIVTRTITVASRPPVAVLDADKTLVLLGDAVTFTGSATDEDGDIRGHFIDFGDGTDPVFAASSSHTYTEPGIYTVIYRATDDSQTTGLATLTMTVENPAPIITSALLTTPEARVGDILLFTAAVDDDDVQHVTYRWDFKDGSIDTRQNAIHTYNVAGTFQVTLTVSDAYGKQATQLVTVQVKPRDAGEQAGGEGEGLPSQPRGEVPLSRLDQKSPGVPLIGLVAALGIAFLGRRR